MSLPPTPNDHEAIERARPPFDFVATLDAARGGEGWAFEQLYRWLADPVTRFAAARRADDPEGVANEVFLRAFHHLDRFQGGDAAFRSWIFAIARNQLIDDHRARVRRPVDVEADVPERSVASAESTAMVAMGAERVNRLLGHLSDDQRDVILLRMIGGLTLNEVAAVVDKPVTAVKALQRRGLRRLQNAILAEVVTP